MRLAGNVCIRNGNQLDYCWRECIQSLLPVCDEVVVCDGESTDGTQEQIREWAKEESKIKLCVYPWPNPKGDIEFWVKWINYAREHITCEYQLQLDADEILAEWCYEEINQLKAKPGRFSAAFARHNFWRDIHHTIPHGVCLSHRVIRFAPQNVWLPSDGPHPMGNEAIAMQRSTGCEIFHYGFLRRREAYFEKSRNLHQFFFNSYDDRLEEVETKEGNWMNEIKRVPWSQSLNDYTGNHPALAKQWLKERGYD